MRKFVHPSQQKVCEAIEHFLKHRDTHVIDNLFKNLLSKDAPPDLKWRLAKFITKYIPVKFDASGRAKHDKKRKMQPIAGKKGPWRLEEKPWWLQGGDPAIQKSLEETTSLSQQVKELENKFLEEASPLAISSVDAFLKDPNIDISEKEQFIKVRIGQGDFRDELIEIWKGCSVTRYNEDYGLLIASHIKPWSACKESRLNPYNGLLLTPNLDKVFDRGLVTFEKDGKIRISKQLKNPAALGISQDMKVELKPWNEPFMEFHRQFKFKK